MAWIDGRVAQIERGEDMSRYPEFSAQIKACWGDHLLVAEDALRIARFFAAQLAEK